MFESLFIMYCMSGQIFARLTSLSLNTMWRSHLKSMGLKAEKTKSELFS